MSKILAIIQSIRFADGIDILVVAAFFYAIFLLLRESRSQVALRGFIFVMIGSLLLFLIAQGLRLQAMILIFQNFWIVVVLIFLIVFQNEFKRALTDVGQMRMFRSFFPQRESGLLEQILISVRRLAKNRTGALIVFERRNPLRSYTATGTQLDSNPTAELIRTIFTPFTPLHDGALVIGGDRLIAAGCILPLTDNLELSRDLGTRHRAAIGLTEETDAIVVVVSEETGQISLVSDGRIERNVKLDHLRRELERLLNLQSEPMAEETEDE